MQREIKFRVWNSLQKQMYYGGDTPLYLFEHLGIQRYPDTDPYTNHYIVMQFTGLIDKNGKEIYEGDIVRFKWNPILNDPSELFEWTLPVEYDDVWGCYVMRIESKCVDGDCEEIKVAVGSPNEVGQTIEVIGTIYKNPDLLA